MSRHYIGWFFQGMVGQPDISVVWKVILLLQKMQGTPKHVQFIFQPTILDIKYQKTLKMQLAVFRSQTDEKGRRPAKIDKTDPQRFSNPGAVIELNNKLSLLTTLAFAEGQGYESKEVEFEMALDVDGNKARMNKKINLKDFAGTKTQGKFFMDNPQLMLFYKIEVKIQGQESIEKIEGPVRRQSKSRGHYKKSKFGKESLQSIDEQESKQNVDEDKKERHDKGKYKTVMQIQPHEEDFSQMQKEELEQQIAKKTSKSLNRRAQKQHTMLVPSNFNPSNDIRRTDGAVNSPSNKKMQDDDAVNSITSLVKNRKTQKQIMEKDVEIERLTLQIEDLTQRLQQERRNERSVKELVKKQQTLKANHEIQIISLKEEIRVYKAEVEKLSKSALNYKQSSNNIAMGSEQQIKTLRQKCRVLERKNQQSKRQADYYESNLRDKDDVINDLKGKIYNLDKENLELSTTIKGLEHKIERIQREYKSQIQELEKRVQELKADNRELRVPSSNNIRDDPAELRKKIENLEKRLEKKEELLKQMTQIKAESETERNSENTSMRRQILELKETIQKLQTKQSDTSSTTSIEYRVQMERMKKQLQSLRKSETKLLIEKTRLENSYNELKDEVVKEKMKIANILNAVQETGNERLVSQCYGYFQ